MNWSEGLLTIGLEVLQKCNKFSIPGTWTAAGVQQDVSKALQDGDPHSRLDGPHVHDDDRQLLQTVQLLQAMVDLAVMAFLITHNDNRHVDSKEICPWVSFVKLVKAEINRLHKKWY